MSLETTADRILELKHLVRDKESLRDHLAKNIAELAAAGDIAGADFVVDVDLYRTTRDELAHATAELTSILQ